MEISVFLCQYTFGPFFEGNLYNLFLLHFFTFLAFLNTIIIFLYQIFWIFRQVCLSLIQAAYPLKTNQGIEREFLID